MDEDLRERYRAAAAIRQEARFSTHAMDEPQRQALLTLKDEIWNRTWGKANFLRRIRLKYVLFL